VGYFPERLKDMQHLERLKVQGVEAIDRMSPAARRFSCFYSTPCSGMNEQVSASPVAPTKKAPATAGAFVGKLFLA
jgi:hypothetical protein